MTRLFRETLRFLGYGSVGAVLVLVTVFVLYLDSRPDLHVWHLVELDSEFTADADVVDLEAYLSLEERLFRELDEQVYAVVPAAEGVSINRYRRGSLSDPLRWQTNWNRSFVLPANAPKAAVLLLHGMSDSPYSLHQLGRRLHEAGAYVVGLRLPGHGTVPSGLVELTWEDMSAAVRLAIRHLASRAEGQPIYVVGYSTGAALAVEYILATLDDAALPKVDRLAMLSPAIGVTPAAALAIWQARLGHLLGLEKLAWSDILPEYDPFKYGSFAVNAGDVVYRLTNEIQGRLDDLSDTKRLEALPPMLAFSSVVDATVSTPQLVKGLFSRLPPGGHELVLFDINRRADVDQVMGPDPAAVIQELQRDVARPYRLSLVTNVSADSLAVVMRSHGVGEGAVEESVLGLSWPDGVYSLAHVALPFSSHDVLYGIDPDTRGPGIHLGNLALRGERGVLQISAADMLRLHSNPFYPLVQQRVIAFFGLED